MSFFCLGMPTRMTTCAFHCTERRLLDSAPLWRSHWLSQWHLCRIFFLGWGVAAPWPSKLVAMRPASLCEQWAAGQSQDSGLFQDRAGRGGGQTWRRNSLFGLWEGNACFVKPAQLRQVFFFFLPKKLVFFVASRPAEINQLEVKGRILKEWSADEVFATLLSCFFVLKEVQVTL